MIFNIPAHPFVFIDALTDELVEEIIKAPAFGEAFDINVCADAEIDTLFDVWVGVIILVLSDIGVEVSTDVSADVLVVATTVL